MWFIDEEIEWCQPSSSWYERWGDWTTGWGEGGGTFEIRR